MFKVDSGIEIATSVRRSKYLEFLQGLKAGQSFAKTEDGEPVTDTHIASLRNAAKELGIKLVTRKQEDGGFRVWRQDGRSAKRGAK
jgi:hypothetical protein